MITAVIKDKTIKPKMRTEKLSQALIEGQVTIEELITFAKLAKESERATCIEALEYITQKNKAFLSLEAFQFVVDQLQSKAPRIKWEAAKVIGNCAPNFTNNLEPAVDELLKNTNFDGTVVRWCTGYALGEILLLNIEISLSLKEILMEIMEKEENDAVKKNYANSIKKYEKMNS